MANIYKSLLTFSIIITTFQSYTQSPNFLFIIADDFGIDACNGYDLGTVNPSTPHLDSLRDSGIQFNNVWATPVCTPTRAGMMSGKYEVKQVLKQLLEI